MSADKVTLDEQLAELRRTYVAQLPAKVKELRAAHAAAFEADFDQDAQFKYYRLAHSLAGSGAIYGFQVIGDKARQLEQLLKPHAELAESPPATVVRAAVAHLNDLEVLVRESCSAPA